MQSAGSKFNGRLKNAARAVTYALNKDSREGVDGSHAVKVKVCATYRNHILLSARYRCVTTTTRIPRSSAEPCCNTAHVLPLDSSNGLCTYIRRRIWASPRAVATKDIQQLGYNSSRKSLAHEDKKCADVAPGAAMPQTATPRTTSTILADCATLLHCCCVQV